MNRHKNADDTFLRHLLTELIRARTLHPGREHKTVALHEEAGEVAEAMLKRDVHADTIGVIREATDMLRDDRHVWEECVQTAVMALRVAVEGDSDFTYKPPIWLPEPEPAIYAGTAAKMRGLSASEAIYSFAGWLTTRSKTITVSAGHDASPVAEAVDEFCTRNNLAPPRDHWQLNLTHPSDDHRAIAAEHDYDLTEMAWGIIANAHGGDWDSAPVPWRRAAEKWRDEYHKTLPAVSENIEEALDTPVETTPDYDLTELQIDAVKDLVLYADTAAKILKEQGFEGKATALMGHAMRVGAALGMPLGEDQQKVAAKPDYFGDVIASVRIERMAQDAKHGGPEHDDEHSLYDWIGFMREHLNRAAARESFNDNHAGTEYQIVRVIALGVAALESRARKRTEYHQDAAKEKAAQVIRQSGQAAHHAKAWLERYHEWNE